jgi:excisionase family DNA binding protein
MKNERSRKAFLQSIRQRIKDGDMFTVAEVAQFMRLNPETVRRAIRDGRLKAVRLGRALRIPAAEMERLFESDWLVGGPIISGHAPDHIREAFLESIENGAPDPVLAGRLWNCTDTMPGNYCEDLGLSPGCTYAQAARVVKREAKA